MVFSHWPSNNVYKYNKSLNVNVKNTILILINELLEIFSNEFETSWVNIHVYKNFSFECRVWKTNNSFIKIKIKTQYFYVEFKCYLKFVSILTF